MQSIYTSLDLTLVGGKKTTLQLLHLFFSNSVKRIYTLPTRKKKHPPAADTHAALSALILSFLILCHKRARDTLWVGRPLGRLPNITEGPGGSQGCLGTWGEREIRGTAPATLTALGLAHSAPA